MKERMIDRSPIGLVSILMGIAVVEGPEGLTRFLAVGDELHAGDTVHVPGTGGVEIRLLDGSVEAVDSGASLHLDPARWQAGNMPFDPEKLRIIDIRDVLPDHAGGADLRLFLEPLDPSAPVGEGPVGEFPLNYQDPGLPGWYAGLGEIYSTQDAYEDYPLNENLAG